MRLKGQLGINIKFDNISPNTGEADGLACCQCNESIPFIKGRGNRIDCEDEQGKLVSYHLACYDLAFYGKVTTITKRKLGLI